MNYRKLANTGIMVSEIGLGSEVFVNNSEEYSLNLIDKALEMGINLFDLYNPEPHVRDYLGKAMIGRRDKFIIQGHLCSAWIDGQYKRTRDIALVKKAYEDIFCRLQTDYIDIGMIHYIDELSDFNCVFNGEIIEFAKALRGQGKIRHIGISTHNPTIAQMAAETGIIEVIMLSINPAYDLLPPSEDIDILFNKDTYSSTNALSNIDPKREALYAYCEANGIALTVMKPFAGGALLSSSESPFGVAMTVPQCLNYCLTRPAVSSVLGGVKTIEELDASANFSNLSDAEKDYGKVLATAPANSFSDKCMYCGHCAPCSVGIDIASVNKFTDLCLIQGFVPDTVREHYFSLKATAKDCIACGICETNCPFGVKIVEHMYLAKKTFGE